jgi:predicted N-acetyltransferase YhbS
MEVRGAHPGERDEVLDLLSLWYNDREFFALYNQNDRRFRDDLCLVARDGGRLVSTVQIFDRAINLDGQAVPMGGIGSVFTREDYRHKGVASQLMRLAVETLIREQFEVSLLFAERLTFYNQFGWREVVRQLSILADASTLRVPSSFLPERFVIDAFDEARDLETVAGIHRAYSGRFNVTNVRDLGSWRDNLKFAGNQPMRPGEGSKEYFVMCRDAGDAGKIAAYARVVAFHGVSMVMEFGYVPGADDAMLVIFKYLSEVAAGASITARTTGDHSRSRVLTERSKSRTPILVTHTAHDPALEARLAEAGAPVTHHRDDNYMTITTCGESLRLRNSRGGSR